MVQPEGYSAPGKDQLVCKLHKSLYGLKQSGRNWNSMLNDSLLKFGCQKSNGDSCVYVIVTNDKKLDGMILIWVDDIIMATGHKKLMKQMKDHLKGKFKMKDMGRVSNFLGIRFLQSRCKIEMDQSHYLLSVLKKYGMSECKPRSTPCELSRSNTSNTSPLSDNPRVYREVVGSLLYATTCTRPDLSWVVSNLSQHLANPDLSDWVKLKHVLKYVKGTLNYKLCYTKSADGLAVFGYSDSDWGASNSDRRSTTGYYFALNSAGPPISWKSRKQPTVALSSCEAEYMALSASTQEAMYLITVMKDYLISSKPVIHSDSQSALSLIQNPIDHNRTKHIDIRFHFVREKYAGGLIDIRYIPREENVADLMTKAASKPYLNNFHVQLFGT